MSLNTNIHKYLGDPVQPTDEEQRAFDERIGDISHETGLSETEVRETLRWCAKAQMGPNINTPNIGRALLDIRKDHFADEAANEGNIPPPNP